MRRILQAVLAFVPWIIAMYTLYWLQYGEIWTTGTPHRGKMTVTILVTGMVASFLVSSYFSGRQQK